MFTSRTVTNIVSLMASSFLIPKFSDNLKRSNVIHDQISYIHYHILQRQDESFSPGVQRSSHCPSRSEGIFNSPAISFYVSDSIRLFFAKLIAPPALPMPNFDLNNIIKTNYINPLTYFKLAREWKKAPKIMTLPTSMSAEWTFRQLEQKNQSLT